MPSRLPRPAFALLLVCASCTFTGLGNYAVETCQAPLGQTSTVQVVGGLGVNTDLTFVAYATTSGADAIGAYVSAGRGGTCIQGVGPAGYLSSTSCAFFVSKGGLSLRQPWAEPLGGGRAAAAVATTAPCGQGQIWFEYNGPTGTLDAPQGTLSGPGGTCDTSGASLPSLAPLGDSAALVTWYQTAVTTREDPLQSCASAAAVPLVAAVATLSPGSASAVLAAPITLTTTSLSVRAPAMLAIGTQVVVAAPSGDDVGIWALDGNTTAPPSPTSIPGLAGARAVSVATDGAGHLAVVAEIGCTPQSIVLATGTLAAGFAKTTTIAAKGADAVVQPTVAWVPSQSAWLVSWIAVSGGAHAVAMRLDVSGVPQGAAIDPGTAATGASARSDGSLLAYVPATQGFVKASLGCGAR